MKKSLSIFLLFTAIQLNLRAQLYTTVIAGGKSNAGVVLKTDLNGANPTVVHDFFKVDGEFPLGKLVQLPNGLFYGMTGSGGINGDGSIFQYNPTQNTYTKVFDFGDTSGSTPQGSLILASDNKFYGMTSRGGLNDDGIIFQFNPATKIFTKKFDFNQKDSSTGARPNGSLLQGQDGKFYGMTEFGGNKNKGVLFQYNMSTNTFTKKIDFDSTNSGSAPLGSLIQLADGRMYGLSSKGGSNNLGVIFLYNPTTNAISRRASFNGTALGTSPHGDLLLANDGLLYGLCTGGGTNNAGVLFSFNPSNDKLIKEISFNSSTTGEFPEGSLIQDSDGKIYGFTNSGGNNGDGTLFQYIISTGSLTTNIHFSTDTTGSSPVHSLTKGLDGKFYGMTQSGGSLSSGVIFQYIPTSNSINVKINFQEGIDGVNPVGAMVMANDRKFYGSTREGGLNNTGVIFQYDPKNDSFTKKIDIDKSNILKPASSFCLGNDGKLYANSRSGGIHGDGCIFQYDPINNTTNIVFSFLDTLGAQPTGSLLLAKDGNFYGLTSFGGNLNKGVLFQFNPITNVYAKKINFDNSNPNIGSGAVGKLVQIANGKIYGIANAGGSNGKGLIFEFDPSNNQFTKKIDFIDSTGIQGESLSLGKDGKLYGLTKNGGKNFAGVLFQYDPNSNVYSKLFDFNFTTNGKNPDAALFQSSNGKLVGTALGGVGGEGIIFDFDPISKIFTKTTDFNILNGSLGIKFPVCSEFIELTPASRIPAFEKNSLLVYPIPSSNKITIQSNNVEKTYSIFNQLGQFVQSVQVGEINNYRVDVYDLQEGIYFIKDGHSNDHVKCIIQK